MRTPATAPATGGADTRGEAEEQRESTAEWPHAVGARLPAEYLHHPNGRPLCGCVVSSPPTPPRATGRGDKAVADGEEGADA
jgi:hypothetical protein